MQQLYTGKFFFKAKINYATIPKEYLMNKNLSMKAKAMLTIIYTLPEEWNYNMKGLEKITGQTEKTTRKLIDELEEAGYIWINKKRDKRGRFTYEYWIHYEPQKQEDLYITTCQFSAGGKGKDGEL